jgi:hypothetical protein
MSFYTCFDWFKKLKLFVNVRNRRIDVVLKASRAIVIRLFSLNEAPLGLFKSISDYLPYFEKINIFFIIITKKVWITRVTRCTTWLRLFLHEPNKNYVQSLNNAILDGILWHGWPTKTVPTQKLSVIPKKHF